MQASFKSNRTAGRVAEVLDEVLAISVDELETAMQEAHQSTCRQMEAPPEIFPVSRQALRMFWRFRRNLEAVDSVRVADEQTGQSIA